MKKTRPAKIEWRERGSVSLSPSWETEVGKQWKPRGGLSLWWRDPFVHSSSFQNPQTSRQGGGVSTFVLIQTRVSKEGKPVLCVSSRRPSRMIGLLWISLRPRHTYSEGRWGLRGVSQGFRAVRSFTSGSLVSYPCDTICAIMRPNDAHEYYFRKRWKLITYKLIIYQSIT